MKLPFLVSLLWWSAAAGIVVVSDTVMTSATLRLVITRLGNRMHLSNSAWKVTIAPCHVGVAFANGTLDATRSMNMTQLPFQHTSTPIDNGQLVLDSIHFPARSDVGILGIALVNQSGIVALADDVHFNVTAENAYVLVGLTNLEDLLQPTEFLRVAFCTPPIRVPLQLQPTEHLALFAHANAQLGCPRTLPFDNTTIAPHVAWDVTQHELVVTVPGARARVFVLVRLQLLAHLATAPSQAGTIILGCVIGAVVVVVCLGFVLARQKQRRVFGAV